MLDLPDTINSLQATHATLKEFSQITGLLVSPSKSDHKHVYQK